MSSTPAGPRTSRRSWRCVTTLPAWMTKRRSTSYSVGVSLTRQPSTRTTRWPGPLRNHCLCLAWKVWLSLLHANRAHFGVSIIHVAAFMMQPSRDPERYAILGQCRDAVPSPCLRGAKSSPRSLAARHSTGNGSHGCKAEALWAGQRPGRSVTIRRMGPVISAYALVPSHRQTRR